MLSVAVALACPAGTPAGAQGLSASQILQQFNAVIFSNFSTNADVEGRSVIGGNMTGGATFAAQPDGRGRVDLRRPDRLWQRDRRPEVFNLDGADGVVDRRHATPAASTLNAGGSVFVGGNNTGAITANNGSASIAVAGRNSGRSP